MFFKISANHSFIIWSIKICSYNLLIRLKGIILHWFWQERIHIIIVHMRIYRKVRRKTFLKTYRIIFGNNRLVRILETIIMVLEHLSWSAASEYLASCSSLYLLIISLIICIRIISLHIIVASHIKSTASLWLLSIFHLIILSIDINLCWILSAILVLNSFSSHLILFSR
jgi:hypothetical protein